MRNNQPFVFRGRKRSAGRSHSQAGRRLSLEPLEERRLLAATVASAFQQIQNNQAVAALIARGVTGAPPAAVVGLIADHEIAPVNIAAGTNKVVSLVGDFQEADRVNVNLSVPIYSLFESVALFLAPDSDSPGRVVVANRYRRLRLRRFDGPGHGPKQSDQPRHAGGQRLGGRRAKRSGRGVGHRDDYAGGRRHPKQPGRGLGRSPRPAAKRPLPRPGWTPQT